jgi:hypothetical protein
MAGAAITWDTQQDMSDPACPYLVCETITYRESLDLSRAAPTRVVVTWYCAHPFHGIRLDLGQEQPEVDERCAVCALPRPVQTEGRRAPARRSARAR